VQVLIVEEIFAEAQKPKVHDAFTKQQRNSVQLWASTIARQLEAVHRLKPKVEGGEEEEKGKKPKLSSAESLALSVSGTSNERKYMPYICASEQTHSNKQWADAHLNSKLQTHTIDACKNTASRALDLKSKIY
jgi:hypothetical protein